MTMRVTNPFSTRHTRPGSIVPLDDGGKPIDIRDLVDRLHHVGGAAAIVGPHGSGKSTLLSRLADTLEEHGTRVVRLRLRSWRDAWRVVPAILGAGRRGAVCIDSWECLAMPARGFAWLVACLAGRWLVVTTHAGGWLPVLARCRTTPELLDSIVSRLPGRNDWYGTLIHAGDVTAAFDRRRGDIREALYDLYDVYEARSRGLWLNRS
jgi:hypothetical protein